MEKFASIIVKSNLILGGESSVPSSSLSIITGQQLSKATRWQPIIADAPTLSLSLSFFRFLSRSCPFRAIIFKKKKKEKEKKKRTL